MDYSTPKIITQAKNAEEAVRDFLTSFGLDVENDPNLQGTPGRVSKMYAEEILSGYDRQVNITSFDTPNVGNQQVTETGLEVSSMCAHHLMPISGTAAVSAYFVEKNGVTRLPGLSKYARIVDMFARRLQLQEALTSQVARYIIDNTDAVWVGVHIRAEHYCMKHRGVRLHGAETTTTAFLFRPNREDSISLQRGEELKRSFLDEVHSSRR